MFIDAIGTAHAIAKPNARIISLVPSLTELLFDMGFGDQVVGRTLYCIHPKPEVEQIASVGGTKKINMAKLQNLKPDYVLLNIDENPKEMAEELAQSGIPAIVTHPTKLSDNRALYHLLGSIFGRPRETAALLNSFDEELGKLKHNPKRHPLQRTLYIIWKEPWMTVTADTYIADVLGHINWQVVHKKGATRYPEFSFSDMDLEQIDLVLFSSEPYAFGERHLSEFCQQFPDHAEKAHLIDGELISWYGSRAIKAMKYLSTFSKAVQS